MYIFFLPLGYYKTASRKVCLDVSSSFALAMLFSYILRLISHFDINFFLVPSNNKKKLLANNQNLERPHLEEDIELNV